MTSSKILFCLTNSPKYKDIQFTIKYDEEKQQILTLATLEPEKVPINWSSSS